MTTDEKLELAQTLLSAAEPLIAGFFAAHPNTAKAHEALQDVIAAAIAGPGILDAGEKADDAAADKALDDRFDHEIKETP